MSSRGALPIHHASLVNDETFADIHYVTVDDKRVVAHRFILEFRCTELLTTFVQRKIKSKNKGVTTFYLSEDATFLTAEALVFFLYYIYCGTIEGYGREVSARNIVKVLRASEVFEFPRLRQELHKLLFLELNPRVIYRAFRSCTEFEQPEALKVVKAYIILNHDLLNESGYKGDSYEAVQAEVDKIQAPSEAEKTETQVYMEGVMGEMGSSGLQFTKDDEWRPALKAILKRMDAPDFKIISKQQKEEGACHKCILAGHSPLLADVVSRHQNGEFFSSLSASGIEVLLSYLYFGAKCTDPDLAAQLLSFGYEFHLYGLMSMCEKTLRRNIGTDTVLYILGVAMHPRAISAGADPRLKADCFDYLVKNLADVDFAPLRAMPPNVAAQVVVVLQHSIGTHWSIGELNDVESEYSDSGSDTENPPSTLIRTLSGHSIDKAPPQISPRFSKQSLKDDGSGSESKDTDAPGGDAAANDGEDDPDSFRLDRFLPKPKEFEDKKNRPGHGGKLQKRKTKKVAGVKDLDSMFE